MDDIAAAVRGHFPVFEHATYLNSCSYGALCIDVKAAIQEYIDTRIRVGSDWGHWVEQLEHFRILLARLLHCSTDDVSISSSVSESVNSLASALDFSGTRNTVVTTDFDFPTTSQIWLAQAHRGARVVRARTDTSGTRIAPGEFERLIDDRTLLVSIPLVCYRNGVLLDPAPIIRLCRERGALVLIDAYQGIGTRPLSMPELDADFLTAGCLKYLIGTAGIGFMYVRDAGHSLLQPYATGWFAQENIGSMDIYHHHPAPTARRFESGTPNVCGLYAASAGLAFLLETGIDAVSAHIEMLTTDIAARVSERGWQLATPTEPARHGAMMAIRCTDAPQLVRRLAADAIVVSDRDGNLRVSPHFYNNESDLDHLFDRLDAHAELLRTS